MRPFARLLQLTCMTALAGAPLVAAAQPGQLTVHDPFYETGRFLARHLVLNGGGNSLVVPRGGRIDATLDVNRDQDRRHGVENTADVPLCFLEFFLRDFPLLDPPANNPTQQKHS